MSQIKSYKDLIVWQKSMDLLVKVHDAVREFPKQEQFGIGKEMKKTSVSIPSNIAEGWGRGGDQSFHYFLTVARGSTYELETQSIGASMLNLINQNHSIFGLLNEISKMLNSLINNLENRLKNN